MIFTLILVGVLFLELIIVDKMSVVALTFFVAEFMYCIFVNTTKDIFQITVVFIVMVLGIVAHIPNIIRLYSGEESKLGISKILEKAY